MSELGVYHWRDGITFRRKDDGSVQVCTGGLNFLPDIPANEWASIVAHLSKDGGTSETFAAATALHDGKP